MDIITYIALALSLFVASPQTHSFFENAPPGAYTSIPVGAACGPTEQIVSALGRLDVPEFIVETVVVNEEVTLHLSLAPTNPTVYSVLAEFIEQNRMCMIEMQGPASDA